MKKKILLPAGMVLALLLLSGAAARNYIKPDEDLILNFLRNNPDKSAIKLVRNDTILVEKNPDKVMPLASTVKIIIAIEYAEQAAEGILDPEEMVSLSELEKFYIPNTDGGAHPRWLAKVRDSIKNDKISIREIAKGMIAFSSNANTEWLSDKLGLEKINSRIDSLGVKKHSAIYYAVAALFVGKEKFPNMKGKDLAEKLRRLSVEEYASISKEVHAKLLSDTTYKNEIGDFGMDIQSVWSDNLPGSTVAEYVAILQKINSRTYFSSKTQHHLDEVMEFILENPANRQWLEHSGMKGGSTPFVLTKALYATDKEGNKTELAYFINDLGFFENRRLQMSMNAFEYKILTSEAFRSEVKSVLDH